MIIVTSSFSKSSVVRNIFLSILKRKTAFSESTDLKKLFRQTSLLYYHDGLLQTIGLAVETMPRFQISQVWSGRRQNCQRSLLIEDSRLWTCFIFRRAYTPLKLSPHISQKETLHLILFCLILSLNALKTESVTLISI